MLFVGVLLGKLFVVGILESMKVMVGLWFGGGYRFLMRMI